MTAPVLTVSKNSGDPATGAITCTWEDTIRLRLQSTAGVRSCRWEIYGYPPGWSAPSGWTEDTDNRVIYATGVTPADFTLPTAVSQKWGKWLLRAIVDGETDGATALEIVSPGGLHATPAGEGTQFGGAAEQWGKDLEENWRLVEGVVAGAGAPTGAAGGDLSGTYPNPTVAKVRGIPLNVEVEDAAGSSGRILVSKTGGGMAPTDGEFYLTEAPTLTGQVLVWDHSGKVYVLQHVDAIVDTDRVLAALAAAAVDVSFGDQELVDVATPTSDGAAANKAFVEDYADTAAAQAASDVVAPWRAQGVAGSAPLDSTTWTTIGTLPIDPSTLPSPSGKVRVYKLHADLEVVEASAGSVQAQVRLLDASLTSLGQVTSTLSGASTFPEHKSVVLTAGGSNGQVRPDATTYLVQLRRQGGSSGDLALCHNAYIEVIWEPS